VVAPRERGGALLAARLPTLAIERGDFFKSTSNSEEVGSVICCCARLLAVCATCAC
jgi:hypothetical protein